MAGLKHSIIKVVQYTHVLAPGADLFKDFKVGWVVLLLHLYGTRDSIVQ